MCVCERRQVCDKEEIKEELDIRSLFMVFEFGILEQCLIVRGQTGGPMGRHTTSGFTFRLQYSTVRTRFSIE